MEEKDTLQWTKLFQDKPIPRAVLDNFQVQIMAKIIAQPVDFEAENRLVSRRRWGLGLAVSLILTGLLLGLVLWFGNEMLYQGLISLLTGFAGLPYVSEMVQFGHRILQNGVFLKELKIELDALWEIVSWPLLGVLCIAVVYKNPNSYHSDSTIEDV